MNIQEIIDDYDKIQKMMAEKRTVQTVKQQMESYYKSVRRLNSMTKPKKGGSK